MTSVTIGAISDTNGNWEIQRVNCTWSVYLDQILIGESSCPAAVFAEGLTIMVHNFQGYAFQGDGIY